MDKEVFKEMVFAGVYNILVWKLGIFPRKLYPEAKLGENLSLDSVDLGDLGAAFVREFEIKPADMARALSLDMTVEELVDFVVGKTYKSK